MVSLGELVGCCSIDYLPKLIFLQGVLKACTNLKARLNAVAEKMKMDSNDDPSWADLVKEAYMSGVDLSEKY